MKIKGLLTAWILMVLFTAPSFAQDTITTGFLLEQMISFQSVAVWPRPSFIMKQASSYDRRSVAADQPGWFANGDYNQFIRKEENDHHTEYVMMDAAGPGAVVRFWLTTVVKPGKLRFYFDNASQASLEIPAYDLLKGGFNLGTALLNPHSSYEPDGKGGNTLYLPLPYRQHCKITFEFTDSATLNTAHYYQVNYRTYAPGTRVKTFTKSDLTTYKDAIEKAEKTLWQPPAYKGGRRVAASHAIAPGGRLALDLPGGAAAVRLLTIHIKTANSADIEKAFRAVIIKIDFDGHETVWCPVGDFSGSGYGGKIISSWYRSLKDDGTIVSRWVMPYQKQARITLLNKAGFAVDATVAAVADKWKWNDASLYFHTSYKYEENIRDAKWDYDIHKVAGKDTAAPIEWNFVQIKGRGIYLGNTLAVNNHMNSWYGEGDAKIWVDGDTFPSEFGTGLEDYYNTS